MPIEVKKGLRYLIVEGKSTLVGRVGEVESTDGRGIYCQVRVGASIVRVKQMDLASKPDGTPVEFDQEVEAPVSKAIKKTGRQPKQKQEVTELTPQQLKFRAKPAPVEEAPKVLQERIGQWPATLPMFNVEDCLITQQQDTAHFAELYEVTIPGGLRVGLVWRSKADGMWRRLGGADSTFLTRDQALANLVRARQPQQEVRR